VEYGFKIWLTKNHKKVFGEGPLELLRKVEELGSLRQAAISMDMSYSKAWKIIKNIETELNIPVLERHIGGKHGGGSTITEEARDLISKYERFKVNLEEIIDREVKRYF